MKVAARRWWIAFLLMLCMYILFCHRVHLGVAMVCMVNATAVNLLMPNNKVEISTVSKISFDKCPNTMLDEYGNQSSILPNDYKGTFVWSAEEQSLLFSASFYGNLACIAITGYLADRFGPTKLLIIAIVALSLIASLTPTVAFHSYVGLVAMRVVYGIFETPLMPAMIAMLARWFTASERSTAGSIYSSGMQLAASFGVIVASGLCHVEFLDGWPLIFYLNALVGIVWLVIFVKFATDSPEQSPFLSAVEKEYLYNKLGRHQAAFKECKNAGNRLPILKMLTSPALFAILVGQAAFSYTNSMLSFYLPTYLRDVMHLDLQKNGVYTSIVFFVQLISKLIFSIIADVLKSRKIVTHTTAAKFFQIFSNTVTVIASLIFAFYIDCTHTVTIVFALSLCGIGLSCSVPGFFTALLSIAPSYTGTLSSVAILAGTIASVLGPWTVGLIVKQGTREEWTYVFIIIIIVNIISGIIFSMFGTAEIQPWAQHNNPKEVSEKLEMITSF